MSTAYTIVDRLRQLATSEPGKTAFIHLKSDEERESLTYGQLNRRAAGVAAWLKDRGAAGQRVILAHPAGLDFIAAFFGCLYAGVQPVPLPAYTRPRHVAKLAVSKTLILSTPSCRKEMVVPRAMSLSAVPAGSAPLAYCGPICVKPPEVRL